MLQGKLYKPPKSPAIIIAEKMIAEPKRVKKTLQFINFNFGPAAGKAGTS